MKQKTLVIGSSLAVGIIAVIICVGMVTGYAVTQPIIPADPISNANTGGQPATVGSIPADAVQYIRIDPVSEKTTGDLLIVTGKTNLPAGTILMVDVGSSGIGYGGDTIVRSGTGGINRFSAPIDTASLRPGTITVTVTQMLGDVTKGDYHMGTLNGTSTFTLKGTYRGAEESVKATVTEKDFITVNPVGDRAVGDQFLISGTTSLPIGTMLMWQVMPYSGTVPKNLDMNAKGIMANNQVTKGDGTANRISLAADMGKFTPGEYIVIVGEMKGDMKTGDISIGDLVGSALFNVK